MKPILENRLPLINYIYIPVLEIVSDIGKNRKEMMNKQSLNNDLLKVMINIDEINHGLISFFQHPH